MRRQGFICPRLAVHLRVWRLPLFIWLAATFAGCADLHDRTSLKSSFAPATTQSYLYGRFGLKAGSVTQPRLFLQLSNLTTGEFLTVHLASDSEEMFLIDVAPGRYQFTHLLAVKPLAMNFEVRRDALRLPPALSFLGRPFDVVAGNAYYVGDWVGVFSRDVDYYVVVYRVQQRWGFDHIGFDFDGATGEMKRLYPAMEQVQTWSAWRDR